MGKKNTEPRFSGKKGIRILTIAESFDKTKIRNKSIFAGAIIRNCYDIEDFFFSFSTLGGLDATDTVIEICKKLKREDVNLVLINGVIVSLYNIIDLNRIYREVKKPLIAVSYRESQGLEEILLDLPEGKKRVDIYRKNGERTKITLKNGFSIFIRSIGLKLEDAKYILNNCTKFGKTPEPIKIVKNLARGVLNTLFHHKLLEAKGEKLE